MSNNFDFSNVDFNLDNLNGKGNVAHATNRRAEKVDLTTVNYKLSALAKLEETSDLGQQIRKTRNENARGGKDYQVLLVNKTCLIVRREYINTSKLGVFIPEKALYNIYNELNGELIAHNDFPAIKKFFSSAPSSLYREIEGSDLVWEPLDKAGYYKGYTWVERYTVSERSTKHLFSNMARKAPYYAIIAKTQDAISSRERFYEYQMFIESMYVNDVKVRAGIKALSSGIPRNVVMEVVNEGITDINVIRNIYQDMQKYRQKLRAVLGERNWEAVQRNMYYNQQMFDGKQLAKFRNYNIDIERWIEWAAYIYTVEEVDIFRQMEHYFDVIKQQVELNNGKVREKYPKMWLSYENKIQKIYRRNEQFIKAKREFKYSDEVNALEHITAKDNTTWQHILKLPRNYGDIIEEGANMNNCVASYGDRVYNHETIILFLRKKKSPERSYVTVEFREETRPDGKKTYRITQVKGVSNSSPEVDAVMYLEDYVNLAQNKHITITDGTCKRMIEDGLTQRRREALEAERQARLKEKQAKEQDTLTVGVVEVEEVEQDGARL